MKLRTSNAAHASCDSREAANSVRLSSVKTAAFCRLRRRSTDPPQRTAVPPSRSTLSRSCFPCFETPINHTKTRIRSMLPDAQKRSPKKLVMTSPVIEMWRWVGTLVRGVPGTNGARGETHCRDGPVLAINRDGLESGDI